MKRYIFLFASIFTLVCCNKLENNNEIRVTGISLTETTLNLTVGDEHQLTANVLPEDATDKSIEWKTSNSGIVSVDNGLVKAIGPGQATITAITVDGDKRTSCVINVDIITSAITGDASRLSPVSVCLSGKANLPSRTSADLKIGIFYSTMPGVLPGSSVDVEAKEFDASYNFSVQLKGLEPEKTYFYRSYICQNSEIVYGDTKEFTTKSISELLCTSEASNVSESQGKMSARLNLTDVEYDDIEYGFKYGQDVNTLSNIAKATNLSDSNYSVLLTGLTSNEEYFFQSYAKLNGVEGLGEIKSFTTRMIDASVETKEASDITEFHATVNGELSISSEEPLDKSVWFLYSSTASTLDGLIQNGTKQDCILNDDDTFSYNLSSLDYNTKYYYVACAKVYDKIVYGDLLSFITANFTAEVITVEASDITEFHATVNGELSVSSEEPLDKSVWFLYSSTASTLDGLIQNGTKQDCILNDDDTFSGNLSSLDCNTEYYYVACAKVCDKIVYGDLLSFTTADFTTNVITEGVSNVSNTKATFKGRLEINSLEKINPDVYFFYSTLASTVDELQQTGNKVIGILKDDGTFTADVSSLSQNTQYYYVACSSVAGTIFYGEVKSFTTKDDRKIYWPQWAELPATYDKGDGIDDKDPTLYYAIHSFSMSGRQLRNYTVCYSSKHHCPMWVAAPRHNVYDGSTGRTDAYKADPDIPSDIQYKSKSTGSGCNKGHLIGSPERRCCTEANRQVFYYSNIAPQLSSGFNTGGGGWNVLEDWVDSQVCSDTLYVVIGCYFEEYTDGYGYTVQPKTISFGDRNDVSFPTMFYYILLRTKNGDTKRSVKDCSATELKCAAFVRSHTNELKGQDPSRKEMMSIADLEKITGFTYFTNVPNIPKSVCEPSDWGL